MAAINKKKSKHLVKSQFQREAQILRQESMSLFFQTVLQTRVGITKTSMNMYSSLEVTTMQFYCDFDLELSNPICSQDPPTYNDVPSN